MPSARELLEQADALMRKNRSRADADIPLLTDAIAIAPAASPLFRGGVPGRGARGRRRGSAPGAESHAMVPSANRLSTTGPHRCIFRGGAIREHVVRGRAGAY